MKIPFDEEIAAETEQTMFEEIFQILKEKHHIRESIKAGKQTFDVVTTLQQEAKSWRFNSIVTLNGKRVDALYFPQDKGSTRITDSEEDSPGFLIRRAAEAHLKQCDNVRKFIETQRCQKQQQIKILVISCLLLTLIGTAGGYLYRKHTLLPHEVSVVTSTLTPNETPTLAPTPISAPVEVAQRLVSPLKVVYHSLFDQEFQPLAADVAVLSGDKYKITFTAFQDAYFYLFQADDTGRAVRLFPMERFKAAAVNNRNPVKAGVDYTLPSDTQSFVFDDIDGVETFYVFAFSEPQDLLESPQSTKVRVSELLQKTGNRGNGCETCVEVLSFEHR